MSNENQTPDRIPELAGFMRARHSIYLARKAGRPGPWTSDPVLANGRFCNVFRELDTVTIWIRKHIREPFAAHPNLWLMLAIARYINWPPTLNLLIGDTSRKPADRLYPHAWPDSPKFKPEHLTAALQDMASTGTKVYTGAYMIRAESDRNKPWYTWTKHRYIAEIVIGRLWEDREGWQEILDHGNQNARTDGGAALTLRQVWYMFQDSRYVGWGPFMAYEVVTDMRHTRYLRDAPDILTWANAGPGAIRGLNRLHGRPLNAQPPMTQTCAEMQAIQTRMNVDPELWPAGPAVMWPRLEMRDVEHSLCEFDKAERVRLNEGKMRQKYDWRTARQLEI